MARSVPLICSVVDLLSDRRFEKGKRWLGFCSKPWSRLFVYDDVVTIFVFNTDFGLLTPVSSPINTPCSDRLSRMNREIDSVAKNREKGICEFEGRKKKALSKGRKGIPPSKFIWGNPSAWFGNPLSTIFKWRFNFLNICLRHYSLFIISKFLYNVSVWFFIHTSVYDLPQCSCAMLIHTCSLMFTNVSVWFFIIHVYMTFLNAPARYWFIHIFFKFINVSVRVWFIYIYISLSVCVPALCFCLISLRAMWLGSLLDFIQVYVCMSSNVSCFRPQLT